MNPGKGEKRRKISQCWHAEVIKRNVGKKRVRIAEGQSDILLLMG